MADLELIKAACTLDHNFSRAVVSDTNDHSRERTNHIVEEALRQVHGDYELAVPKSMRASHYFSRDMRSGWAAYYVLQMFEEIILGRLVRTLACRGGTPGPH